jgi:hypothetical protein
LAQKACPQKAKALINARTTLCLVVRRPPLPAAVEEGETYFVVKDNEGQQLAYVHFDDPRSAAKPLTRDEARRITVNFANCRKC